MFLDRQDELEAFQQLIAPQGDAWLLLYHGLNGLGKTALLDRATADLPAGWVSIHLDLSWNTNREDYDGVLRELTRPLRTVGLPQVSWDAYHDAEVKVQELKMARIQMLMVASQGGSIRDSIQIIEVGKEVAHQYLEAGRELAHAWLDLLEQVEPQPILFLDHWDMLLDLAEKDFATWLVEEVLIRLHRRRRGFRMVIASDRPRDSDRLLAQRVPTEETIGCEVKPLEPRYAQVLMQEQGLTDDTIRTMVLDRVGGNPLLIKLAVDLWREQPDLDLTGLGRELDSRAATRWFLTAICENLGDQRTKNVLERGVVLQHFRLDTLRAVCGLPDLDLAWYTNFVSRSFVQRSVLQPRHEQLYEFQRTVRTVQLSHMWQVDVQGFRALHGKALAWYRSVPGAGG